MSGSRHAGIGPALHAEKNALDGAYRRVRERLVYFFQQKSRPDAEDLADEVICRAHQRLVGGVELTSNLQQYCYGIATHVMFECDAPPCPFDESLHSPPSPDIAVSLDRAILLDQFMRDLDPHDHAFILSYYRDDRGELAASLGASPNAVRLRAFRIVEQLREKARRSTHRHHRKNRLPA